MGQVVHSHHDFQILLGGLEFLRDQPRVVYQNIYFLDPVFQFRLKFGYVFQVREVGLDELYFVILRRKGFQKVFGFLLVSSGDYNMGVESVELFGRFGADP